MDDQPKKPILKNLDLANLGKFRSTRLRSARGVAEIKKKKQKIRWRRIAIDAAILATITLVAYACSCFGSFVFNDHYIDKLISIRITDENFWSNLVMKAITQPLSQPWVVASFAFDLQNFGMEAAWYHIVNLVLHFLACFYFYILTYRLTKRFWPNSGEEEPIHAVPMLAAAILACHPLACESAAHITGRSATITACNIFLALNFFLSGFFAKRIRSALRNYIFTFIFFILAIFSDCQGLALPLIMLVLILLFKDQSLSYKNWFAKKWSDLIFVIFLLALVPLTAIRGFSADFSNGFACPLPNHTIYIASQFKALVTYYLRCFFVPVGLSVLPPHSTADGVVDIFVLLGVVVVAAGFYFVYRWRKEPLASFGLILALTSYLAPMFFVQNEIAADRRFYLSIAGLSILIASKLKSWLDPSQRNNKIRYLACLTLLIFCLITIARTFDFHNDIDPPLAAKRVNERDAWAKGILALSLVNAHQIPDGINNAKESLKINDTCQPAYLALGKATMPQTNTKLTSKHQYEAAKIYLEKALDLAKSQHLGQVLLFDSQVSLANALVELNQFKEAQTIAAEALTINVNSISLDLIMGKSLNGLGDYINALRYLDKGFSHDRTNPDYIEPLIEAALGVGTASTISTAYHLAQMGLQIKQSPNLQLLMARASFSMLKFPESIRWTDMVLREEPNNAKALYLRSFQLLAMRQIKEGEKMRTRAFKLEPNLKTKMKVLVVNKQANTVSNLEKDVDKFLKAHRLDK